MNNKVFLFLFFSSVICSALATAHNYTSPTLKQPHHKNRKLVFILKDKKGNMLGNVYVEDFINDVFKKLLILKEKKGKTDTLYFIDGVFFKNPKGIDITSAKENFNGYKIEKHMDDSFSLFSIGKGNNGASDPAIVEWNYKKRIFEVWQEQ